MGPSRKEAPVILELYLPQVDCTCCVQVFCVGLEFGVSQSLHLFVSPLLLLLSCRTSWQQGPTNRSSSSRGSCAAAAAGPWQQAAQNRWATGSANIFGAWVMLAAQCMGSLWVVGVWRRMSVGLAVQQRVE